MRVQRQAAPLRQQVLELLRQDILDARLVPGQRLLETTMCAQYSVSRTVIREVLRQLESEHLITMVANHGPIVTVLSAEEIRALYEVRASLEGLAGELFASRASEDEAQALLKHVESMAVSYVGGDLATRQEAKEMFYRLLLLGAHNLVLEDALAKIHSRVAVFRHYAFVDQRRVVLSMRELVGIVQAASVDRDSTATRRACEEHIRLAGELALLEYERRLPAELDTSLVPTS